MYLCLIIYKRDFYDITRVIYVIHFILMQKKVIIIIIIFFFFLREEVVEKFELKVAN